MALFASLCSLSPALAYFALSSQVMNGSTNIVTVPFPYIAQSDVKVSLNGSVTTAFSWLTSSTIQFTASAGSLNGSTVALQRMTAISLPSVVFAAGSLDPNDLNLSSRQHLYVEQEMEDQFIGLGVGLASGTPGLLGRSGNTTIFGTVSGALASGYCLQADQYGNITTSGSACLVGSLTAATILPNGVTGTTQALTDNSNKVATDAFVQGVAGTASIKYLSNYSPVNDGAYLTIGVSIASGSHALTLALPSFSSGDCHTGGGCTGATDKAIIVSGAGASGAPLVTTITGYTSTTQVTLAGTASSTLSSSTQTVIFGTDNTTAIQNWINACLGGATCVDALGSYVFTGTINITAGMKLQGHGGGSWGATLYYAGNGTAINVNTNSAVAISDFNYVSIPGYGNHVSSVGFNFTAPTGTNYGSRISGTDISGFATAVNSANAQQMFFNTMNINNVEQGFQLADAAQPYAGGYLITNVNVGCNVADASKGFAAISLTSGGNLQVSNSMLHFCQYALVASPNIASLKLGDIYFSNVSMEQNSQACVYLQASAAASQDIDSATFTGGDCAGGTPNGFYLGNLDTDPILDVAIHGMQILPDSATSSPAYGITVHGGNRGTNIGGNMFGGGGGTNNTAILTFTGAVGCSMGNTFRSLTHNLTDNSGGTWLTSC